MLGICFNVLVTLVPFSPKGENQMHANSMFVSFLLDELNAKYSEKPQTKRALFVPKIEKKSSPGNGRNQYKIIKLNLI